MKKYRICFLQFFFLFIAGYNCSFSQESTSYFYENEFDVSLPLKDRWSMDFGLGNRGMLQERLGGEKIESYQHEHVEFNHFTNYKTRESLILSLGLRYRFRDIFESSKNDEIRIIEQAEIKSGTPSLGTSHRFRLEQRFRAETIHRLRYALSFSKPLNNVFSMGAGTEALFSVSKESKPEAEQRFSLGLENTSFDNLELQLEFEYRLENYNYTPAHEFFIITGIALSI